MYNDYNLVGKGQLYDTGGFACNVGYNSVKLGAVRVTVRLIEGPRVTTGGNAIRYYNAAGGVGVYAVPGAGPVDTLVYRVGLVSF